MTKTQEKICRGRAGRGLRFIAFLLAAGLLSGCGAAKPAAPSQTESSQAAAESSGAGASAVESSAAGAASAASGEAGTGNQAAAQEAMPLFWYTDEGLYLFHPEKKGSARVASLRGGGMDRMTQFYGTKNIADYAAVSPDGQAVWFLKDIVTSYFMDTTGTLYCAPAYAGEEGTAAGEHKIAEQVSRFDLLSDGSLLWLDADTRLYRMPQAAQLLKSGAGQPEVRLLMSGVTDYRVNDDRDCIFCVTDAGSGWFLKSGDDQKPRRAAELIEALLYASDDLNRIYYRTGEDLFCIDQKQNTLVVDVDVKDLMVIRSTGNAYYIRNTLGTAEARESYEGKPAGEAETGNAAGTGNAAETGNTAGTGNAAGTGNSVGTGNTAGAGNDEGIGNSVGNGNTAGTGNTSGTGDAAARTGGAEDNAQELLDALLTDEEKLEFLNRYLEELNQAGAAEGGAVTGEEAEDATGEGAGEDGGATDAETDLHLGDVSAWDTGEEAVDTVGTLGYFDGTTHGGLLRDACFLSTTYAEDVDMDRALVYTDAEDQNRIFLMKGEKPLDTGLRMTDTGLLDVTMDTAEDMLYFTRQKPEELGRTDKGTVCRMPYTDEGFGAEESLWSGTTVTAARRGRVYTAIFSMIDAATTLSANGEAVADRVTNFFWDETGVRKELHLYRNVFEGGFITAGEFDAWDPEGEDGKKLQPVAYNVREYHAFEDGSFTLLTDYDEELQSGTLLYWSGTGAPVKVADNVMGTRKGEDELE